MDSEKVFYNLKKYYDYNDTRREWKIQLTMQINFISSKDSEETSTMHTKSHNIEIMMGNETDEIIEKLFESLLQNYHKDLEEPMRGSKFVPGSIDLLYYHLQKIGLKRGRSYVDRATINPKNNDDNYFQYALTVALNPQKIGKKKKTLKEYGKLDLLLISIIGKK